MFINIIVKLLQLEFKSKGDFNLDWINRGFLRSTGTPIF